MHQSNNNHTSCPTGPVVVSSVCLFSAITFFVRCSGGCFLFFFFTSFFRRRRRRDYFVFSSRSRRAELRGGWDEVRTLPHVTHTSFGRSSKRFRLAIHFNRRVFSFTFQQSRGLPRVFIILITSMVPFTHSHRHRHHHHHHPHRLRLPFLFRAGVWAASPP